MPVVYAVNVPNTTTNALPDCRTDHRTVGCAFSITHRRAQRIANKSADTCTNRDAECFTELCSYRDSNRCTLSCTVCSSIRVTHRSTKCGSICGTKCRTQRRSNCVSNSNNNADNDANNDGNDDARALQLVQQHPLHP